MAHNKTLGTSNMPHVCVVGAGISGLRCAALLIDAGFRVTILEARDRIGGRVSISHAGTDGKASCWVVDPDSSADMAKQRARLPSRHVSLPPWAELTRYGRLNSR